ncbi:preprotein translocase subunit SecA [Haloglycomyces albus]|uniref:preprotein translocase subunit SecA n=1 Tax=Haloglycomyces albus TaxID=526067 RepID=UPI00046CEC00|nr:preprotein translocase subunit SecA [Haloglycomyces albus]
MSFFERILRAGEGRQLKRLKAITNAVNSLEDEFKKLSDAELRATTDEYKERLADGATLDELMPEAFATVRETAWRVQGKRPYDVQIMGGAALHQGNIAEMKTGEGKTLASTLPAYLNALTGKGVHIVTVNDYLVRRDAEWMGEIHRFLGLTVGVAASGESSEQRREAYACDITYSTNNELAFDYLRDNMTTSIDKMVQRGHNFAIVDEVDSILIDEARTPIIISGPADHQKRWYSEFAKIAKVLKPEQDYEVDEGKRTIAITEEGVSRVEDRLGVDNLYDSVNTPLVGYLNNALKAKELFADNREYIVAPNGDVNIVDEFTGRVMEGRRFNDGIHQAIEAKEGVDIKQENQTFATTTLQNYFRMYDKLAGLTGTAQTEAAEFHRVYDMGVVPIATNKPMIRLDQKDVIYKTEEAKYSAVVDDIAERYETGQPVLVGTVSVDKSEELSAALSKRGIRHNVLNAKNHAHEADIIAQAGRKGAVTVATNMAGRGTDIHLGGNPEHLAAAELRQRGLADADEDTYAAEWEETLKKFEAACEAEGDEVCDLGGLYVLGTERHESRRIDNQLRGRSGRQGDPGESRFYLSLSDDLMKRFNADVVKAMMNRLRVPDDVPIESKMVTRQIQSAQTQIESHNGEIRKKVLEYDEVLNKQREVVYGERLKVLKGEQVTDHITNMIDEVLAAYVEGATSEGYPEEWDLDELWRGLKQLYPVSIKHKDLVREAGDIDDLDPDRILEALSEDAHGGYSRRRAEFGEEVFDDLERRILLQTIDKKWREHLYEVDYLKQGISLRAYAQRDPLIEYKREAYDMFQTMMDGIKEDTVRFLMNAEIKVRTDSEESSRAQAEVRGMEAAKDPSQLRLSAPTIDGAAGSGATEVSSADKDGQSVFQRPPQPVKGSKRDVKRTPGAGRKGSAKVAAKSSQKSRGPRNSEAPPAQQANPQQRRNDGAPNRNAPCHCGSGKKFKKCHGAPGAN